MTDKKTENWAVFIVMKSTDELITQEIDGFANEKLALLARNHIYNVLDQTAINCGISTVFYQKSE